MENSDEFQDWEVLHHSDDSVVTKSVDSAAENLRDFEGIVGVDESEGMIRVDYFSIDAQEKYAKNADLNEEEGSVESDNPSWIDPAPETRYPRKQSGEFWSDSGSDRSDERKFGDSDGKHELGFAENEKYNMGSEGVGLKIGPEGENLGRFSSDSGGIKPFSEKVESFEMNIESGVGQSEALGRGRGVEALDEGDDQPGEKETVEIDARKSGGEVGKRTVVWWKLPLEFLKYCVFRASPALTVSVAAALMGFIILGRRLYKMKRKSRSLPLQVTMDDKKVSQFMTRAARLNEAFSVVKRVPIIRPALPAAGVTPWPVMTMR